MPFATPVLPVPVRDAKPKGAILLPEPLHEIEKSPAIVPATRTVASEESNATKELALGVSAEQSQVEVEAPEPAAGADAKGSPSYGTRRLFLLTNQMNLIGILSSRMLAPRESFQKYYADLLELSPGWVPLLTVPPTTQLVERVVAEGGAGGPVLLELSESVLNGRNPDPWVTYVRAALLSDVVAIHFREIKSLREHRARRYSNVHSNDDLLKVSPELFGSTPDVEIPLRSPEEGASVNWLQIDRVRGATNGLLAAADSGEGLAVAAGTLDASQVPKGIVLPHWLTWASLTGRVTVSETESEVELADRLIFQTVYRILGERDRAEYWSASEVLETVVGEIHSVQLSPGVQVLIDRNLQRVREIVNVERDFEPFRNPGSPYVAAKSFLMVLMRPDLGQLLDWPTKETGADPTTRTVAAVLAGRLRGLARESVKLRNKALDDITAAYAVHAATGATRSLGVVQFMASRAGTALLLNGMELHAAAPLMSVQP